MRVVESIKWILVSMSLVALSGCRTPSASTLQNRGSGTPVNHDQAVAKLNDYGAKIFHTQRQHQDRLNTLFDDAKVTNAQPLAGAYTVSLGPNDTCFADQDLRLRDSAAVEAFQKQLDSVATFLREFHYELLGKNSGMFGFKRIELCPKEALKADMVIDLYILKIGVPRQSGAYTPLDPAALRDLWNKGYPIGIAPEPTGFLANIKESKDKARGIGVTFWKLFNPLSPIRKALRKLLHELGIDLFERAGLVLGRFPSPKSLASRADLSPQEKDAQLADQKTYYLAEFDRILSSAEVKRDRLQHGALADVLKAGSDDHTDNEMLYRFFETLQCFLASTKVRAGFEDQSMALVQSAVGDNDSDIETEVRAGLVAVGNHHSVHVNLAVAGVQNFERYFEKPRTRSMRIRMKVTGGLVAVGTSDDVDVQVDFNFVKGSRSTGAVDAALFAAVNGGNETCARLIKHD